MVPSEAEIEARLAELRRRREAIDREIADHLLYLELGRRLRSGTVAGGGLPGLEAGALPASRSSEPAVPAQSRGGETGPAGHASDHDVAGSGAERSIVPPGSASVRPDPWGGAPDAALNWSPAQPLPAAPPPRAAPAGTPPRPGPAGAPPPVSFDEDPAAARRYGRALVEAAVAVLAEAGRPMHAGEILERLAARGFGVPGQDPVAALNTRLWKRSGPGGPLRRLGDAVYDRAGAARAGLD
ncbi:HTH domain-containing protein [Methylobacterium radiodurans]|uniref:HTH HARE-type domain-containing protein n=1 Tax=Methylobacterium radiodurans TaxID=2202828 RepID=A0A2U8VVC8_9HYPH|nr:HTH domain-containing protein [Methylobacterium radiodurans]AWN37310.1 hypothetical protein DK427_17550 [Methylobacterium radiodurans]